MNKQRNSNTHCQAALAKATAHTWQSGCLFKGTDRVDTQARTEKMTEANSNYKKGGVSCSNDRFVVQVPLFGLLQDGSRNF